uniref:Sulfate permease family protein n=1 Tax=Candidatus Kentrum sp. LPFa TaxID=2126335 RepID=A0A450WI98_9GAMM|nr:MAG: Sulfate permease family protein [Candidatus Kentron sp. LPFa]VFK32210.1 MAG: Sulfate permease family protein [Candidatus Kentron sp. LPFa]
MVGVIQLVFGLLRLGVIFSYFSHAAMVAIITGVGVIIIVQQAGNFMGQVL